VKSDFVRIIFRALFTLALLIITWLAFAPESPEVATVVWDKGNHLLAFFVLGFLADFSFLNRSWLNWLGLACYGIAIECIQWILGYRFFELNDIAADLSGLLIYLVIRPYSNRTRLLRGLRITAEHKGTTRNGTNETVSSRD